MKKSFLMIAACAVSMLTSAQIFQVQSIQQLPAASFEDARVAGVSPNGDYVLMTTGAYQGLVRYDIATGEKQIISQAANAGFDVQISRDGKELAFSERTFNADKTTTTTFVRTNISKNNRVVMASQQAALTAVTSSNIVLSNEEGTMYIVRNGKRILVAPFGTEDRIYIWTSLSPDKSKICYHLGGKGTYVCNLDGSNNQLVGRDLLCPQWYDNHTLIGTHEHDNGRFITAAAIVAYTLDGKVQTLTTNDMIAMDPYAANGKIVFSTAEGNTYVMNVK